MDNNQKVDILFDSAQNLFDVAEQQQDTIKKLIDNVDKNQRLLNSAIRSLNETSQNIEQNTIYKVDEKSKEIAQKITESTLVKFEEANEYAEEATKQYKKVANWSVLQTFLFTLTFFVFLSLVVFGYYKYFLPNEISNLNFQKNKLNSSIKEMQQNIKELKELGGNIKIRNCTINKETGETRKCVKIDTDWLESNFVDGNELYYIIKGH